MKNPSRIIRREGMVQPGGKPAKLSTAAQRREAVMKLIHAFLTWAGPAGGEEAALRRTTRFKAEFDATIVLLLERGLIERRGGGRLGLKPAAGQGHDTRPAGATVLSLTEKELRALALCAEFKGQAVADYCRGAVLSFMGAALDDMQDCNRPFSTSPAASRKERARCRKFYRAVQPLLAGAEGGGL